MRKTNSLLTIACTALIGLGALPSGALAQPAQSRTVIPDQEWYPDGYLDLRIVAAQQLEEFPRDPDHLVREDFLEDFDDSHTKIYDLVDCNLGSELSVHLDNREVLLSELALDVARMRAEFAKLGYRKEIYDEPLLRHERALLAVIEANATHLVRQLTIEEGGFSYYGWPEGWFSLPYSYEPLLSELESRRMRLQPDQPRFVSIGECGASEDNFKIKLIPASGELWLINAFAFRVCEHKVPNAWDHTACGWTQYQEGDTTLASGRYMYEARWPNGTVKRGARILELSFEDDETGAVTFRRD
jgi:hypothetical protein